MGQDNIIVIVLRYFSKTCPPKPPDTFGNVKIHKIADVTLWVSHRICQNKMNWSMMVWYFSEKLYYFNFRQPFRKCAIITIQKRLPFWKCVIISTQNYQNSQTKCSSYIVSCFHGQLCQNIMIWNMRDGLDEPKTIFCNFWCSFSKTRHPTPPKIFLKISKYTL